MAKVIKREESAVHRIGKPKVKGEPTRSKVAPPQAEPPRARRPASGRPPSKAAAAAEGEAKSIIARAKREARELATATEAEVKAAIEAARDKGKASGLADTEELQGRMKSLGTTLQHEVEPEALKASMQMARRFIETELERHPEVIVDIVRQALLSVRHQREVFVRVNPDHVGILEDRKREIVDVLGRAKDIDIREDPDLEPGGCVIETEIGAIDARLETQFEVLGRALTSGGK